MSMYSVTANTISYLDLIQKVSAQPDDYPEKTLLMAVYGSRQYYILEAIVAYDGADKELIEFTKTVVLKILNYIKEILPDTAKHILTTAETGYDPTIRVNLPKKKRFAETTLNTEQELEEIGFIDLPAFTFYYYDSKEVEKYKKEIKKKVSEIRSIRKDTKKLIEDYSYENKTGIERAISYALRKNNAEAAKKETKENTDKINKLSDEIEELREKIAVAEKKDQRRLEQIKIFEGAIMKMVQMPSEVLVREEEKS